MSKSIEIKIDGPNVTPGAFLQAVENFFKLVEGVSRNISESGEFINWTVEVAKGSAIVRTKSESRKTEEAAQTISRGINSLRSGLQIMPRGFTDVEVRAARALARIPDGMGIHSVAIQNGAAPEDLSEPVAKTADAILTGERFVSFGSIEGKVDSVSDKEGYGFTCSIFEPIYKKSVPCSFDKRELEDQAYAAFRKRVLVGGMIRYGKDGTPTSVNADVLRVFPDDSELPTVQEIQAIYREIYK